MLIPIDFFPGAFALQPKEDLDLPKFELLLSALKDFQRQVLSSTYRRYLFDLLKADFSLYSFIKESNVLYRTAFLHLNIQLPLGSISRSLSREEIPHDN